MILFSYLPKFFVIIFFIEQCYFKVQDSYGPYTTRVTQFRECAAPPGRRTRAARLNLSWTTSGPHEDHLQIYADVLQPVGPVALRMKMFRWNGTAFILVNEYRVKNICQHFMWAFVRPLAPWVQERRCTVPKGPLNFVMSDYNHLQHQFVGDKFFYGKYKLISHAFSIKNDLICLETHLDYNPIDT